MARFSEFAGGVMVLRLSATTVKHFFQYRCDRQARYNLIASQERESIIPLQKHATGDSWAETGVDFEKQVVDTLASTASVLAPASHEKFLSPEKTVAFLTRQTKEMYATQLQLQLMDSSSFLQSQRGPFGVEFAAALPDLVRAEEHEGQIRFRVIDVKAVQEPALFHKAQVAFYAIVLAEMLHELGASAMVDDVGEIWHFGEDETQLRRATEFRLEAYRRQVMDFFQSHLGRIASARVGPDLDESRFHIYYKCEQCSYLPHCAKAIADDVPCRNWDISAIPGMSQYSKQTLAEVGIRTLGELADNPGVVAMPGAGWGLNTHGSRFVKRAESLLTGSVVREPERYSYLLPPKIDVTVSLVVDQDPVENRLAALGCFCALPGRDPEWITAVITESGADAEREALWRVLSGVCRCLDEVDLHNRKAAEEPWFAHILVYEPSEAADLANALGRHLGDAGIRGGLLHMVRMFPPESLQREPEYGGPRHLPATALRSVFDVLYALPARVSFDLARVSQALANADSPFANPYLPSETLQRPFSSRLSIDACRGLKSGDTDPALVERDVRERQRVLAELTHWVLAESAKASSPFLRLKKDPFRWQTKFHPLDAANLQLLEAQELLNTRTAELAALTALAEPPDQRKSRFACVGPMQFVRTECSPAGAGWAAVRLHFLAPVDCGKTDLGPSIFGVVLTDGDPDMLLDAARWPDIAVSIHRIDESPTEGDLSVEVDVRWDVWRAGVLRKMVEVPRAPANGFYLDRAFFDVNGPRVLNFLQHLE